MQRRNVGKRIPNKCRTHFCRGTTADVADGGGGCVGSTVGTVFGDMSVSGLEHGLGPPCSTRLSIGHLHIRSSGGKVTQLEFQFLCRTLDLGLVRRASFISSDRGPADPSLVRRIASSFVGYENEDEAEPGESRPVTDLTIVPELSNLTLCSVAFTVPVKFATLNFVHLYLKSSLADPKSVMFGPLILPKTL